MNKRMLYRADFAKMNEEGLGGFILEYYLLIPVIKNDSPKTKFYEVEVVVRSDKGEREILEQGKMNKKFSSRKMAELVIETLHRNLVTPTSLDDIEVDMFGRKVVC